MKGQEPFRIGIIGGGIGGLALAQLLRNKPNIQVTVYERSAEAVDRLSGYRVMLSYFVLQNLQATLSREIWNRIAPSIGVQPKSGQELRFMKSNGKQMFSFDAEDMKDSFSVARWTLRKALLYKSDRFVRFGKTFQKYEKMKNGTVKIYFEGGSTDDCDLLVGADGMNSRVKRQLVPDAKVTDSDLAVIYFKIPLTHDTKELLPTPSASVVRSVNNASLAPWLTAPRRSVKEART